jgi:hypothetical protein
MKFGAWALLDLEDDVTVPLTLRPLHVRFLHRISNLVLQSLCKFFNPTLCFVWLTRRS